MSWLLPRHPPAQAAQELHRIAVTNLLRQRRRRWSVTPSEDTRCMPPAISGSDRNREGRDHEVVEHHAHRRRVPPAVRHVHEGAPAVAIRHMPAANKTTSRRTAEKEQGGLVPPGWPAGRHQQGDLGRDVEAEPKQQPDRVAVPGLAHRRGAPSAPAARFSGLDGDDTASEARQNTRFAPPAAYRTVTI